MSDEGYTKVYELLKEAIKSDYKNVNEEFIKKLKEALQHVLSSEPGYSK